MESAATSNSIGVLVADSNQMQSRLLAGALKRRPEFHVSYCELHNDAVLDFVEENSIDVVLITPQRGLSLIRALRLNHPHIATILLVDGSDFEGLVDAFRAGVRGVFSFVDLPFRLLCKCIHCVHRGEIWVSNEQLKHLVETVTQVPSLRVVNSNGRKLLTPREEQVVALVADGLSNREVAHELGLSEHTVKKYLFRIFDKVGVSSRVELVLYAVTRGTARTAEWIPAAVQR